MRFILSLLAFCTVLWADQPNILWITAEDMSPTLGCYGDKFAITPNIDRLAKQSVRYTKAFASAPVCSPSHMIPAMPPQACPRPTTRQSLSGPPLIGASPGEVALQAPSTIIPRTMKKIRICVPLKLRLASRARLS